jgi:hypothetical protein
MKSKKPQPPPFLVARLRSLGKLLLLTETLFELSYASTSIEDALLAGVERVAYRTDFNIN